MREQERRKDSLLVRALTFSLTAKGAKTTFCVRQAHPGPTANSWKSLERMGMSSLRGAAVVMEGWSLTKLVE